MEHCHSLHRPTGSLFAASTAYIRPVDMTLQTALPMMIAAVAGLLQAHPVSFLVYVVLRVGESTINHCGHDTWIINLITLKLLSFRASVQHHDEHHHLSNYARNAKNYGENLVIWDWVSGALRPAVLSAITIKAKWKAVLALILCEYEMRNAW